MTEPTKKTSKPKQIKKVELKTKKTDEDVMAFIDKLEDEKKRDESRIMLDIMKELSGSEPKLWGGSIIGFGDIQYTYSTGRQGDWFKLGFSPRKAQHSIYIMSGFNGIEDELSRLGTHKLGKGCLYVKSLEKIDLDVLKEIISKSLKSVENNNAILAGC